MALDGTCPLLDRRMFLAGAATAAMAAGTTEAMSATDPRGSQLPQVMAEITAPASLTSMRGLSDAGDAVRVVLSREAAAERASRPAPLDGLEVGDWFIALGQPAADGSFSATRVIPAVLGAEQPPRP
jgi:hypothetical protein